MAETTDDVRRDIEVTRERMTQTLAQLENKLNVMQIVRDHPWPAIALAVGAGIALSGSGADVTAAAATAAATKGSSRRIGNVLDELVANLMTGVHGALQDRVESLVGEIKGAIGAPTAKGASGNGNGRFVGDTTRVGTTADGLGTSAGNVPRAD